MTLRINKEKKSITITNNLKMKNRILTILLLLVTMSANAQNTERLDSLDSPLSTIYTYLHYLQTESYDVNKAARTFKSDSKGRVDLALQLKQILDGKGLYVDISTLPAEVNFVDSLSKKKIYKIFPKELPLIYVQKYGNRWYFSSESAAAIPRLHKEIFPFGADLLVNIFPKFGHYKFLSLAVWQWTGGILILVIAFLFYKLISLIIRPLLNRVLATNIQKIIPDNEIVFKIARLLSIILVFIGIIRLLPILQLPIDLSQSVHKGLHIVKAVFFILLFLRIADLGVFYIKQIVSRTDSTLDDQLVPILRTTFNVIIIISGVIQVLTLLEVNVNALIAGVSIGGLAIALAAQETVKNLLGSLMIFTDKPFQIGDLIKVQGIIGTVEVVGFRSTRIRTLTNSLIAIPNGTIANEVIDNFGLRTYRKMDTSVGVTYDTSPDVIETFIDGIRKIIDRHPRALEDTFSVYFSKLSASSLDILINGSIDAKTWTEELQTKQDILLAVIRLASILDISFAFPSTSIYIEKEDTTTNKQHISAEEFLNALEEQFKKPVE